mgnify:CR=1 FL=1
MKLEPVQKYRLDIRIEIRDETSHLSGGLSLSESRIVTASDFFDLARILARFDDLLKSVQQHEPETQS